MSERAKSLLGADFTGAAASTLFDSDALALSRGDVVSARLNGRPFTVSAAEYGGLKMYYLVSLLVPGEYISLSALDEAMVRDNLGTLRSAADRALQGADNRAIRGYLEAVKHSSALIERALVNSSLLGRLSCGDEPMHNERIELGSFLSDLTDPVIGFAVARGVTLELSAEPVLGAGRQGSPCHDAAGAAWALPDASRRGRASPRHGRPAWRHDCSEHRLQRRGHASGRRRAAPVSPDRHSLGGFAAQLRRGRRGASALHPAPIRGRRGARERGGGRPLPAQAFNRAAVQLSPWLRPEDYDYRLFEVD